MVKIMSKLLFLKEYFKFCEFEMHDDWLYIINPGNQRKIYVDYEYYEYYLDQQGNKVFNATERYTFRFETQHQHFENKEMLIKCIEDYISEKVVAIEFYEDGKNRFGGEIEATISVNATPQIFSSCFRYSVSRLNGLDFEIKSWNGEYDASGKIQKVDGEYIILKRLAER